MTLPSSPQAQALARAGQAVREQLHRLDGIPSADASPWLTSLFTALDEYEAAVLACVPPAPTWQDNPNPTAAELLAEREATPVYRLGWVRGYKAGQVAGQRRAEPALQLYARHAVLPDPDPTALLRQVRRFIVHLQQRRGAGSSNHHPVRPAA